MSATRSVGGRHADRGFGERVEAVEGRLLLGVEGVVDDVVEDAAHCGGLIGLNLADDFQFGVFVGPLELVADAGGGLHLEAFADDRGEGFLVAGLLCAFGDDLGFAVAGEDHVVLVEEELGFARGQRGDGAGVLGALGDDGGYFLGEQHLAGVECHDDGFLSDEEVLAG